MDEKINEYAIAIEPALKGIIAAMGPTKKEVNRNFVKCAFYEAAELVVSAMTMQREGDLKFFDPEQRTEIIETALKKIFKKENIK